MSRLLKPTKLQLLLCIGIFLIIATCNVHAAKNDMLTTNLVTGTWNGIYQCSAYPVVFELDVKSNGKDQLTAQLRRKQYRSNGQPYPQFNHPDVNLVGSYSADTGIFMLKDPQNMQRNALGFNGVVDAKTQRLAALITVPRETNCSYAVAGKKNFKNTVNQMMEKIPPHNERIPAQVVNRCDQNIADWLQQPIAKPSPHFNRQILRYGALELFEDERFKPYFGKSYLDMSPKENIALHLQVARTCWQTASKAGTGNTLDVIRSKSRADLIIYGYSKDIVQQWRRQVLSSLDDQSPHSINTFIQSTQNILAILWPIEEHDIRSELANKQFKNNNKIMLAELKKKIESAGNDFNGLVELANFGERILVGDASRSPNLAGSSLSSPGADGRRRELSRRELILQERMQQRRSLGLNTRSQMDRANPNEKNINNAIYVEQAAQTEAHDKIRSVINKNIKKATPPYLADITQPNSANSQLKALMDGPNNVLLKYLSQQNEIWLSQKLSERRNELVSDYVKKESSYFSNNVVTDNTTLNALKKSNAYEATLAKRYGELSSAPEFMSFYQDRKRYRIKLISNLSETLSDQIRSAKNLNVIDSLISSYLQEDELKLSQAAPIRSAINERKQVLAPFLGYPAADFLNALYANDTGKVRQINQRYIDKMQRSINGFLGSRDFRTEYLNSMASHISLMTPTLATYLFAYDRKYTKCLRDNAVEFTVTTHVPGSVTTNLLGVEVSRTYGYSSAKHYKVNHEFADIFRKIGKTDAGGLSGMLVDKLLSDGSVTDIRKGVEKIMSDYDCDSDVIMVLESNMRSQYQRN